ncbi:chromate transporter [Geobacter pelophilus]|uniref:Chromate transporter n=1 Tax=Geoanaerobacter pelophilus TaxID=60036 RepID=A0AAW4L0T4_9BACT|nr:chromate transporter [Geoanaerobacter pelophilus]MBT0664669.1 chromate transporter [Geoanaerobacter pelophilus]
MAGGTYMLLWDIFLLFTRVSLFSWGGGPASLALMQRETTKALWVPPGTTELVPWVTPLDFSDAVAVGNALPGPIAPQVSAYIGYKMAGLPGAIAAAAGTVLPTTLLMLLMVAYFFRIKDSLLVQSMLRAVRPVVVGLLLWTAYDMAVTVFGVKRYGVAASLSLGWDKLLIVAVTFSVLTLTEINPALVVLVAAVCGGVIYR